jgi:hypothetical protein
VTDDNRARSIAAIREGFATLRRMFPAMRWRIAEYAPTIAFATASVVSDERSLPHADVKTMQMLAILCDAHNVSWADIGVTGDAVEALR